MDAWIREAEEASRWVEDLESRFNSKNLNSNSNSNSNLQETNAVVDSARSKLLELGVKLDRLESLLRNPPTKPILTDEDLDFRWKLLSDIQLRTRTLARTIYALPSPYRPRNVPATGSKESRIGTDRYDQVVDLIETSHSHDHSELPKPLLSDDANKSQLQIEPSSFMSMISLWKACSTIFLFLGLAALVFLAVLLFTAI